MRPSLRNAIASGLSVGLISLVAAASSQGASSVGRAVVSDTVRLHAGVFAISADGNRVALGIERKVGAKTCRSIVVWQAGHKTVTRIGRQKCQGRNAKPEPFDALTLAGTRVVWVSYEYGNMAYCIGPFTATLAAPKPVQIPSDCTGDSGNLFMDFAGQGSLIAARDYDLCYYDCPPDYNSVYEENVTLFTLSRGGLHTVMSLGRDTQLLGVDSGRILLQQAGNLEIVDAQGTTLGTVTLPGTPTHAWLSGGNVAAVVARAWQEYDVASGSLVATRQLPSGSKPLGFVAGNALYSQGSTLHLLRLSDGRDTVVAKKAVTGRLTAAGLFYLGRFGRVVFIPAGRLPAGS
jgi:hypothetical protein